MGLDWHLGRTVELERILDEARLEEFLVVNEGRTVGEVAHEVLARAGWLASPGAGVTPRRSDPDGVR
jgi:hypothetical protein